MKFLNLNSKLFIIILIQLVSNTYFQVYAANIEINNRTVEDWLVVDLIGKHVQKPGFINNHSTIAHDDVSRWPVNTYYWQAPTAYYTWKIYTYGGDLKFLVSHIVTRGDTSGSYLDEPDLVLEGGSERRHLKIGYRLSHTDDELAGYDRNRTITMPLTEDNWYYLNEVDVNNDTNDNNNKQATSNQQQPVVKRLTLTQTPVSREDFSLVLAGLNRSLIRAKYHMDQVEGNLFDVNMHLLHNTSRTIQCDNDCSGALLDDLDAIGLLMDEIRSLLPQLKDGPWRRLRWLSNRADELERALKKYLDVIALGQRVLEKYDINFAPETLVGLLELRAANLMTRAPIINADADAARARAQKMLDDILKGLWDEIRSAKLKLNDQTFGPDGTSPEKLERILAAAELILKELRNRNFQPGIDDAERELRRAKQLLEKIKTLLIDPEKSAELLNRLAMLEKILNDFSRIIQEQISKPAQQANNLVGEGKKKYLEILELLRLAEERAKQSQDNMDEANKLLELTKACLAAEGNYLSQLPRQLADINASITEIERKRSILTSVNPDYQKRYVDKCSDHERELLKKLAELEGLFNATRDVADYALRAANVYKNIVTAVLEAEKAAKRAFESAEKAYKVIVPDFDESLAARALAAKKKSYELLEKAKSLRDKDVQRLAIELAKYSQQVELLFKHVAEMSADLDAINAGLKLLGDKNLLDELQGLDQYLKGLMDRLDAVHKKLQLLHDIIYNTLLPQYKLLMAGSQSSLGNSSAILENIKQDLQSAIKYGSNARALLEKLLKLEAKLDLDLDLLRRKIQLGHQEATSIHVSLMPNSVTGICTRSYFVPASLSALDGGVSVGGFQIKDISLVWSLHSEAAESLLLFIGSKKNDDFVAVELYERHIRLVYNLNSLTNSGTQTLTHPLNIDLNDNQLLSNNFWYKIAVSFSPEDSLVKLSVRPMSKLNDIDNQVATQRLKPSSNADATSKMKISPYGEADIHLFIGGLPPSEEYTMPKQLKSTKLAGCLYDFALNEQQIGLWNFKTNQGCEGCMEGPTDSKDVATFSFTGSASYSTVSQNYLYDKTRYMVSMSAKTNEQNALLFLTLGASSNHYWTIYLSRGRVCLLVGKMNSQYTSYLGLSSSSLFEYALQTQFSSTRQNHSNDQQAFNKPIEAVLCSSRDYNNNRWFKLTAAKEQTRLILSVDDEYKESNIDEKLLSLDLDQVFVGGVWPLIRPARNFANTSIEFNSLTGCLKDIQIESTPVDLLKRQSYGVEIGCSDTRVTKQQNNIASILYPLPAGR